MAGRGLTQGPARAKEARRERTQQWEPVRALAGQKGGAQAPFHPAVRAVGPWDLCQLFRAWGTDQG